MYRETAGCEELRENGEEMLALLRAEAELDAAYKLEEDAYNVFHALCLAYTAVEAAWVAGVEGPLLVDTMRNANKAWFEAQDALDEAKYQVWLAIATFMLAQDQTASSLKGFANIFLPEESEREANKLKMPKWFMFWPFEYQLDWILEAIWREVQGIPPDAPPSVVPELTPIVVLC